MAATCRIDQRERWGVEFRTPGGRWTLIGTVGSEAECMRWIPRMWAKNADFRIQRPTPVKEVNRASN